MYVYKNWNILLMATVWKPIVKNGKGELIYLVVNLFIYFNSVLSKY